MLKIRRFNNKSIDKQYNIEEILRKNDIISVARDLGLNIQKSMVPCVNLENHIDKRPRPTMSLNPINNRFKCWVCRDVEGDVIDLVRLYKKVSREKALQYLAIRSEARDSYRLKDFFKKEVSREEVYKQFPQADHFKLWEYKRKGITLMMAGYGSRRYCSNNDRCKGCQAEIADNEFKGKKRSGNRSVECGANSRRSSAADNDLHLRGP